MIYYIVFYQLKRLPPPFQIQVQHGHQRVREVVEVVLVDNGEKLLEEGLDEPLGAPDPVQLPEAPQAGQVEGVARHGGDPLPGGPQRVPEGDVS